MVDETRLTSYLWTTLQICNVQLITKLLAPPSITKESETDKALLNCQLNGIKKKSPSRILKFGYSIAMNSSLVFCFCRPIVVHALHHKVSNECSYMCLDSYYPYL